MEPFHFAQPRRSGVTLARSLRRPAWRRPRWLGTLTGTCLAAVMAGWPAMLVGAGIAGGGAAGPSYVVTALQGEQARVVDPGPPTGLAATPGSDQVSLSWIPPASDGGAEIIGYDVYLGTSSHGESAAPVNSSLITSAGYTVTGLANGTTYYFTVDAVNDADLHSAASAEASATPVAPTTAPGSPSGLTATAGNAQVSLSWTAPASDGGSPLARYQVYLGTTLRTPGTSDLSASTPVKSVAGTSTVVTGLTNGTTYYFVVTAVNADGTMSSASGEASAEPTENAVLTSKKVPKPVIISLAGVAIGATAGALTLGVRRLRPRSRPPLAPPADVRAVPDKGRPGLVSIQEIGTDETYTVRFEPLPAAIITTIEELVP